MIIFGTKTRISNSSVGDILEKSCPQCGSDLKLCDLKRWFTLYFIPIFPFKTIESLYKCNKCEQTYKESVKGMLAGSKKDREKIKVEGQKIFVTTLAACMTYMAKIDGKISKEEKEELKKLASKSSKFKSDIEKTIDKISKSSNGEMVFNMLRKAKNILTTEGIMVIIGQVARMLLVDGKIDKKEEKLMKDYLLVSGVPRELYSEIINKVKKNM